MSERLDQIEAILATVAQQQQQAQLEIAETRRIVDSTARSVAANSDLVAANTRNSAELDQRLESAARTAEANSVAITETRLSIAAGFEATRQAIAETREGIDDVVRMVGTASAQAEEDRQRNDQAHRAFTESFQSLLAEIARIWQRLSA